MKPIEFRGKETMSYNKTEKPLPPAEGAEKSCLNCRFHNSPTYHDKMWCRDCQQLNHYKPKQPTAEGAEEIAQCCPVCGGNGLVPCGFYNQTSGHWGTTSITPETCRSCNGTGVVFATLHAQKIADKMVEERMREELIKFAETKWDDLAFRKTQIVVDEYLKSR